MKRKRNHAPALQRSMTAGQMEMISLGGAIGVGFYNKMDWAVRFISLYVCWPNSLYCHASTW